MAFNEVKANSSCQGDDSLLIYVKCNHPDVLENASVRNEEPYNHTAVFHKQVMTAPRDEGRFPGRLPELSPDPGSPGEEPRSGRVAQGLMGPVEGCGRWRGSRSPASCALGLT